MPISFEEAAIAWARLLMRAEQAEAKVKELEDEVAKLKLENGK